VIHALLLAAGFGTRLRPLTDTTPKCLVPIHGRPLLEIWLDRLTQAGIGPFLLNTHYLADRVRAFIDASPYRAQVTLVHEPQLLGTAGTLAANLSFFKGGDGLLAHADNYCTADFAGFLRAHSRRPAGCLMTMMTFRAADPSSCGIVGLDRRGVVTRFEEKVVAPSGNLANGAVYVLSAELLSLFGGELAGVTDFSTQVLPRLIGRIYTYETDGILADVGTPEAYAHVNRTPLPA
jgi:mannose-1-phosphate guanylyltransferase